MAERRKKPETPEETRIDIESHPERGMFTADDGRLVPAIKLNTKEVRGTIPDEAYDILLDIWGAKGLDKADGVRDMVNMYITDLGNLQLTERSERIKAELYGVSPREVRSKKKGIYKARARERKANIQQSEG